MKKFLVIALAMVLAVGIIPAIQSADAGMSKSYVISENSIENGSINGGDVIVSGNVKAEGSYAVFDSDCANNSKLLMKTKIYNMKKHGINMLFNAKMNIKIDKLSSDGSISLNFGLNGLQLGPGSKDSFNIVFTENKNASGVNVGVFEYVDKDRVIPIKADSYSASASGGKVFVVDVAVDSDRHVTIKINDLVICENYKLETDPCGYISIVSDGKSDKNLFRVGELSIYGYRYDLPDNIDYIETFDNDAYNSNVFMSQSLGGVVAPSGLFVKDGKLRFENASGATILTKYKYSNFSMEFDLMDIQRVAEKDANGSWIKLISSWFALCFGVDDYTQSAAITEALESYLILEYKDYGANKTMEDGRLKRYLPRINGNYRLEGVKLLNSYNLWDVEKFPDGTIFNIKFVVQDGVMKYFAKTSEDADYTDEPLFEYDAGVTDMGYVGLFTCSEQSIPKKGFEYTNMTNFSIDNLKITNLDYNKETLPAPPFVSNKKGRTPDYEYNTTPDESDLLGNKIDAGTQGGKRGCNSSINYVDYSLFIGAMALVAITLNIKRRNKR